MKLKALAKKHGGGYSLFSKRFLFDTAENRDKFIREATQENSAEENITEEQAWEKIQNLFDDLSADEKISEEDNDKIHDEFNNLVGKINGKKITSVEAYEKLKGLVDYAKQNNSNQNEKNISETSTNENSDSENGSSILFGYATKDGIHIDSEIKRPHGKNDLKFSGDFSVDNDAQNADNTGNHLTDAQKTNLFNTIKKHIEKYIAEQKANGLREPKISKKYASMIDNLKALGRGCFFI